MQYEIYIDSLFLLNLGMNLYLLELTDVVLIQGTPWRRILCSSLAGSFLAVFPLLLPVKIQWAGSLGMLLSILWMGLYTFRVTEIRTCLKILEILSVLSLILGAVLRYVIQLFGEALELTLAGLLAAGGVCFLTLRRMLDRRQPKACRVLLINGGTKLTVNALVDTGNSLVEPISGVPVAVLDKKVFDNLFSGEKPAGFRVIPYRSIDKKNGVLPGYPVPKMEIRWRGVNREFSNAYVGVGEQLTKEENYKMILNPEMLKGRKTG